MNARSGKALLLAAATITLLAGCATPLDREAARSIHTVALLPPDDPAVGVNPVNNIAGVPGPMAGLVGALLAPGGGAEQSEAVDRQFKQRNLHVGWEFTDQIEAALRSNGYRVVRVEGIRRDDKGHLLDSYEQLKVDTDAILDVSVPVAGFYDKPLAPYYPNLVLHARLVDAKSKRELFSDRFVYGGITSLYPERVVEAESKYSFWDRDDIAKSPEKAEEGMRVGIASLVELLRKKLAR